MTTRSHIIGVGIALLALACVLAACGAESSVNTPSSKYPLAPAGRNVVYIDGVKYPFADDLDYAEYYAGADLADEYDYYTKKGFHSFFNIDLNADSEFIQMMILDIDVKPGIYQVRDTELAGVVRVNYDLGDTITNQQVQIIKSGTLEITSVDIVAKRVSGVFTFNVQNVKDKKPHVIDGSFTDIYLKYGSNGGEVMTADVSANGLNSIFKSGTYYPAFANAHGQGVSEDYYTIQMASDETDSGYESLQIIIPKPIVVGPYDLAPGAAIYTKYSFDHATSHYIVSAADTNANFVAHAITVTDFDTVRRRISGTFDFTIEDNSARSPVAVHDGKFVDLFWW